MIHRFIDAFGRISPPFSAFEGSSGDGDQNVYRRHFDNAPGDATRYTDWDDGGSTIQQVSEPVLSPDQSKIAFTAVPDATGLGELWVVDNVPNSTATMLVNDASSWISHPMWSPDSSTIVYARGTSPGNVYGGKIETVPATGGSPTVLYTPATNFRGHRPAYSYDGAYIAFVLRDTVGSGSGLRVMEADGSNNTEIDATVDYTGDGSRFGWANSSLTIAYDDGSTGTTDVFTIAHDGTGKTTISTGATSGALNRCSKFCWLADDSSVIVSVALGGTLDLYALDPAGGGETLLNSTHGPANQDWFRQVFVFEDRLWFIEKEGSTNQGTLGSTALDGSDYIEELDVNDATLLDWFFGGNGFEFQ